MSNVPMVQGLPVDTVESGYKSYHEEADDSAQAQELRPLRQSPTKQYQDVGWAVAFIIHLIVIIFVIVFGMLGSSSAADDENSTSVSYTPVIFTVGVTGLTSLVLSSAALTFMMKNTEILVQTSLLFSVASSLAIGILGFMTGSMLMGALGLISFAVGIWYAKVVWPRIPFAATNLKTALTAVQANSGLLVTSFGFTLLAFVWTVLWFLGVGASLTTQNLVVVFLLFLSYYWVHNVLQNTMHVTTAGTVATWWFVPDEASTSWSQAMQDSLFRALSYSFGSICFGSFLVSFVQALRALENYTRDEQDAQFLHCIIQCILACIESIIEYINRWAYVYVGMYGFSYLDAGRSVIELFQNKGWTVVITDDLASNVLFMISVAIGLGSGLVGLVIGFADPNMFASYGVEQAHLPAFFIGLLSGFLFSGVILSVVDSAINTVIVCYAEDPAAFQQNHPHLATAMRSAWTEAWPGISM